MYSPGTRWVGDKVFPRRVFDEIVDQELHTATQYWEHFLKETFIPIEQITLPDVVAETRHHPMAILINLVG
jgi:hypothetical protein